MREMEIIQTADTMKEMVKYFGGDQFLDMRRWFWRVGSHWIDIAFTEEFNRPGELPLGWDVDCPRCYVEYDKVTIATIEMAGNDYICIFDNQMKRSK